MKLNQVFEELALLLEVGVVPDSHLDTSDAQAAAMEAVTNALQQADALGFVYRDVGIAPIRKVTVRPGSLVCCWP